MAYTRLKYIESNGTQYIDTRFKPTSENLKVSIVYEYTSTPSAQSVFGSQQVSPAVFNIVCYNNPNAMIYVGNSTRLLSTAITVNTKYDLEVNANNGILTVVRNGVASSATYTGSLYKQNSMFLFANSKDGEVVQMSNLKLFSCQIYDNDVLVRDYIPMVNEQGICGLYDKVNGEFYASPNGNNFVGHIEGEELPIGYTLCEYIESDGTNFIDTGLLGKSGLQVQCKCSFSDVTSVHNVFGVLEGTNRLFIQYDNAEGLLYAYGAWNDTNASISANEAYEMDATFNVGSQSFKLDGTELYSGTNSTNISTSLNAYLFALNLNGTPNFKAKMRLYYCRIYDNGSLIRDYVPCQSSDGVYGLYDKVNNTFVTVTCDTVIPTYTWTNVQGVTSTNSNTIAVDGITLLINGYGDSSESRARCTFKGVTSITFNCWYDGENNFDYLNIGNLDSTCTRTIYGTSLKGTRGTTKTITFLCTEGEHYVEFCYSKDSSVNSGADCGYVYIESVTLSVSNCNPFTGKWAEDKKLIISPDVFRRRLMSLYKGEFNQPFPYARYMGSDGVLYKYEDYDNISVGIRGVVLFCEECDEPRLFSRVIGSAVLISSSDSNYGGYNASHYNEGSAREDYNGYDNTTSITNWANLQSKQPSSSSAYYNALNYSIFSTLYSNGFLKHKPHLPSLGEMVLLYKYKELLQPFYEKIEEGVTYKLYEHLSQSYWTSTLRSFNMGAYETWGDWWAYSINSDTATSIDFYQNASTVNLFLSCGIVNMDNVVEMEGN